MPLEDAVAGRPSSRVASWGGARVLPSAARAVARPRV